MTAVLHQLARMREAKRVRRVLRNVSAMMTDADIWTLASAFGMTSSEDIASALLAHAAPEERRLGAVLTGLLPEGYTLQEVTPSLIAALGTAAAAGGRLSVDVASEATRTLGLPPAVTEGIIERIVELGDGALTFASLGALFSEFEIGAALASRMAAMIPGPVGLGARVAPFILPLLLGLFGLATDDDVIGALPAGTGGGGSSGGSALEPVRR